MEALRDSGVDARMLVAERLSDSSYIRKLAPEWCLKSAFLADRLRIALANGFDRKTLFKLDAAAAGIDVSNHPWVRDADAVLINWINQGVLSLRGIRRLFREGKKVVWTMHDMWNFTGLCHHAGDCVNYLRNSDTKGHCGCCLLLGKRAAMNDFSRRINDAKRKLYEAGSIQFVAVSSWLAERARESYLLGNEKLTVIPNPFKMPDDDEKNIQVETSYEKKNIQAEVNGVGNQNIKRKRPVTLIFGAARLDDPIKDFPMLIKSLEELRRLDGELADEVTLHLFGGIKDASLLQRLPVRYEYHGIIREPAKIAELYGMSDIVISTSRWETLPGTLIEGQAYGCWPVAFRAGGQPDIISHGETGWLVEPDDESGKARRMAEGIAGSVEIISNNQPEVIRRLKDSVREKFSPRAVARKYIDLITDSD